jgi:hypothetical protein
MSVTDLIIYGKLGFLHIGCKKDYVQHHMGKARHQVRWAPNQNIQQIAWVYEDLCIGFGVSSDRVCHIGVKGTKVNRNLHIVTGDIYFGIETDEFENNLETIGISNFKKYVLDYYDYSYELPSGANVWFHAKLSQQSILHQITIGER